MVTKAVLQSFLSNDGCFAIICDNNQKIFIGYPNSPQKDDVSIETIQNEDFLVIHNTQTKNGQVIQWKTYHPLECIQTVGIMDSQYVNYGPDIQFWV